MCLYEMFLVLIVLLLHKIIFLLVNFSFRFLVDIWKYADLIRIDRS